MTRHLWKPNKERAKKRRLTSWAKKVYARRKETVERSFADTKQHHGYNLNTPEGDFFICQTRDNDLKKGLQVDTLKDRHFFSDMAAPDITLSRVNKHLSCQKDVEFTAKMANRVFE